MTNTTKQRSIEVYPKGDFYGGLSEQKDEGWRYKTNFRKPNLPNLGDKNNLKDNGDRPSRLTITYKDQSKETYKEASIGRRENNTLWVLFFGRVICLTNVETYSFAH